ncbi:MAG: sarcosine oxidase subunit gamma [Alphaproteobacteria bacterium]
MDKFSLAATAPLAGAGHDFDGVAIRTRADSGLVSVAVPRGGEAALTGALRSSFDLAVPKVGGSTVSADGEARLLGLQRDLFFLLIDEHVSEIFTLVVERLGETAYLTDQSDSWTVLEMSGAKCRAALERVCPIDLHPPSFPEGSVTRTVMEHFGVIILCDGPEKYRLMSATSSVQSFLDVVEASVRNTAL